MSFSLNMSLKITKGKVDFRIFQVYIDNNRNTQLINKRTFLLVYTCKIIIIMLSNLFL